MRSWRKAQRAGLVAHPLGMTPEERERGSAAITARLASLPLLERPAGTTSFYWPFRGEYDLGPLVRLLHARGVRLALSVVIGRGQPVAFRAWWPGMRMRPGVFGIPMPDEGEWVRPHTLLVPPLGFDALGYRLGHGGGYYDRILAAAGREPAIGGRHRLRSRPAGDDPSAAA